MADDSLEQISERNFLGLRSALKWMSKKHPEKLYEIVVSSVDKFARSIKDIDFQIVGELPTEGPIYYAATHGDAVDYAYVLPGLITNNGIPISILGREDLFSGEYINATGQRKISKMSFFRKHHALEKIVGSALEKISNSLPFEELKPILRTYPIRRSDEINLKKELHRLEAEKKLMVDGGQITSAEAYRVLSNELVQNESTAYTVYDAINTKVKVSSSHTKQLVRILRTENELAKSSEYDPIFAALTRQEGRSPEAIFVHFEGGMNRSGTLEKSKTNERILGNKGISDPIQVVPIFIGYDNIGLKKGRVIVRVGDYLVREKNEKTRKFNKRFEESMKELYVAAFDDIAFSLITYWADNTWRSKKGFYSDQIGSGIESIVRQMVRQGFSVDPCLMSGSEPNRKYIDERLRGFLYHCTDSGLLNHWREGPYYSKANLRNKPSVKKLGRNYTSENEARYHQNRLISYTKRQSNKLRIELSEALPLAPANDA
ncbi:MAG: hypothetical protein KKF44_07860 [Nanoarchaeota archaeon]|nr:hypothetical protein [Nanoarchaeota archaeon]